MPLNTNKRFFWDTLYFTVFPGADHALGNAEGVFILASALLNNWHIHLHQLHWTAGATFIVRLFNSKPDLIISASHRVLIVLNSK